MSDGRAIRLLTLRCVLTIKDGRYDRPLISKYRDDGE